MGRKVPYYKIAREKLARKMDAEFWKEQKAEWKRTEEEELKITKEYEPEREKIDEPGPCLEELMKEKYRCRSAYKLIEINEKYKIFKPGQVVVDLGCCPGSWTQVAVKATRAMEERFKSLVIGLDIQETKPIEGAYILNEMDFLEKSSQKQITQALKNRRADVVISDMAPNTTGIRFSDHVRVSELCHTTLKYIEVSHHSFPWYSTHVHSYLPNIVKPGGSLVMKAFDGEECRGIVKDVRYLFEKGVVVHPKATRQPSSEFYYVGLKYKGNKLEQPEENICSDVEQPFYSDYLSD